MVKRTSSQNREPAILAALSAALSEDELQRTLAAALVVLDADGLDRLVARLGASTGAMVRTIISASRSSGRRAAPRPPATSDKIRQEWDHAWAAWEACVEASSAEDGPYVVQDHEWDAPYLDTGAIAEDLEKAATRIHPLLSRVLDDELHAPTFRFADVLRETAEAIGGGLPDWMNGTWEPAWFGPVTTRCLLEAEWRMHQRAGSGAFECLDALLALEQSLGNATLDGQALTTFVLGLSAAKQREILAAIRRQHDSTSWRRALETSTSGWAIVARTLAQRWGQDRDRGSRATAARVLAATTAAKPPRSRPRNRTLRASKPID